MNIFCIAIILYFRRLLIQHWGKASLSTHVFIVPVWSVPLYFYLDFDFRLNFETLENK